MSDEGSPSAADPATPDGPAAPESAATATSTSTSTAIRPSTAWYWIGGFILGAGSIGAIIWFFVAVVGLATASRDYARVDVPGSRTLTFNETGEYTIFAETTSTVYRYDDINEPTVKITGPGGVDVPVDTYFLSTSTSTYNDGGNHGRAIATVDINTTGAYDVEVTESRFDSSTGRTVRRIAIGKMFPASAAVGMGGSVLLGTLSFLVGLIILIVVAVRRSSARRKLRPPVRRPAYPYGAPPPGWRPPGPPPPGAPPGWMPPPGPPPPGWMPPPGPPPPGWGAPAGPPPPGWGAPAGPPPPGWGAPASPAPWAPPGPAAPPGQQGPPAPDAGPEGGPPP